MGAQFLRHGTGVMRDTHRRPDHPVMKGYTGFESWDETYVHHKHNRKAGPSSPTTWTRQHASPGPGCGLRGRGVSSTPPGVSDERDLGPPRLREPAGTRDPLGLGNRPGPRRGIRRACPLPLPTMTPKNEDVKPFVVR